MKREAETKVLVLGIDSATFNLIKPWARSGDLPNFRKILERGFHAPLLSTIPPNTPPAWTSLVTGVNPGKHGIFDFFELKGYEKRPVSSRSRRFSAVWNILSSFGLKVAIYKVPVTYPPERVNGVLVSGMLTPSLKSDFTYPREFKKELLSMGFRLDVRGELEHTVLFRSSRDEFRNMLLENVRRDAEIIKWMAEGLDWDLAWLTLMEVDHAQHFFWRYMEGDCESWERRAYGDTIKNVYKEVDRLVGDLMRRIEGAIMFLVSDHGACKGKGLFLVNNLLLSRGFLVLRTSKSLRYTLARSLLDIASRGLGPALWRVLMAVPGGVRRKMAMRYVVTAADMDFGKTIAFMYSSSSHGIRLNVQGREPHGVVSKQEYEHVRRAVARAVKSAADMETKEPIVKEVYAREELYWGPYVEKAPDLILELHDGYITYEIVDQSKGLVDRESLPRSGEHKREGIFMAYGPGVRKGSGGPFYVWDVVPTILFIMGLPLDARMDGKPILSAFEAELVRERERVHAKWSLKQMLRGRIRQLKDRIKGLSSH